MHFNKDAAGPDLITLSQKSFWQCLLPRCNFTAICGLSEIAAHSSAWGPGGAVMVKINSTFPEANARGYTLNIHFRKRTLAVKVTHNGSKLSILLGIFY